MGQGLSGRRDTFDVWDAFRRELALNGRSFRIGRPRMSSAARAMPAKLDILRDMFGFDAFRPGQDAAIDAVLAGRNVLSVMPTGSGKSLCFQVPALVLGGLTIVVSPLVALMQDQVAALRLAGVAADTINSSRDRDDNVAAWRRAAAGETRLLYLSPERLMTDADAGGTRQASRSADRRRRSALHLAMGPGVPPRLRSAVTPARRIPARAHHGADGDRRREHARRYRDASVRQQGRADRARLRPSQHQADACAQAGLEAAASRLRESASRPERHRLLPVAQTHRGSGSAARGRTASMRSPITPA